jgi:hypothetical protein
VSVDAAEPEEEPGEDERLADDDTPVRDVAAEEKLRVTKVLTKEESDKLSAQIWEEYASGMGTTEIADLHGLTRSSIWQRIKRFRVKLGIEDPADAKALDLGRYEALIERVWSKTFKEPTPENVRSLAMLMEQRARLLGLNAPKKLQVDGQMSIAPSPAMVMVLDRLAEERNRLDGTIDRPAIEGPDEDIVEAELVDDP